MTETLPLPRTASADPTRRDLLVLGALAVALRLPTFFAAKHLTFDDGVFGASAVALRNGGVPFREVFSGQGPLFLPLVWIADTLGLHTLNGPRLLGLASGLGLVIVLYLAGREIAGTQGGRVAGTLAAVTGSSIAVTGSLAADGPALVLATTAFLLALRYRSEPTTRRAISVGLVLGAALMVKALVLPVALPIGLILLWGRRPRDWAASVGSAVAVGLGLSLLWGFADVWDQSVLYHLDAPGSSDPITNLNKVISTFFTRDLVIIATGLVALVAAIIGRRDPVAPGEAGPDERAVPIPLLLWSWLAAMTVMLVLEHPLWRPHIASLVPSAALLVAWYRPPWKPFVVVSAAATVFMVLSYAGPALLWAGGYEGDEAVVVDALRALPPGALAISDEPGQVWRAGRRTPDLLVDASSLLTDSGRLTAEDIAAEAGRDDVCAVVVWSDRFGDFTDLPDLLAAEGYVVAERFEDPQVLYLKTDCSP